MNKEAICIRCNKDFQQREEAREHGEPVCVDSETGKRYKRHQYDF